MTDTTKRQFLLEQLTGGIWHEDTANQYLDHYDEHGLDQDMLGVPMFQALALALIRFHLERTIDGWAQMSEPARQAFRKQAKIAIAADDYTFAYTLEHTNTLMAAAAGETTISEDVSWQVRNTESDFGRVHDLYVNGTQAGCVDEDFSDGCDAYDSAGVRLNDEPLALEDAKQLLAAVTLD